LRGRHELSSIIHWRLKMARATSEERLTEDEIARRKLGPRGVPGGPDTAKMTPQQEKNIPKTGVFDGHTA
jgi:spore coat protein CotH